MCVLEPKLKKNTLGCEISLFYDTTQYSGMQVIMEMYYVKKKFHNSTLQIVNVYKSDLSIIYGQLPDVVNIKYYNFYHDIQYPH